MWCRAGAAALFAVLAALAGCGFEPLHGSRSCEGGRAATGTAAIAVGRIDDRLGQVLRNVLRDRLNPSGKKLEPLYTLEVVVDETVSQLLIRRDAASTFSRVRVSARYILRDRASNEVLDKGRASAAAAFNVVESGFANIIAERATRNRAAREVARDIHTRLSVFLRARGGCG